MASNPEWGHSRSEIRSEYQGGLGHFTCLELCLYGIDLGASIVKFSQSEHSISAIWTNESGALCSKPVSPSKEGLLQALPLPHPREHLLPCEPPAEAHHHQQDPGDDGPGESQVYLSRHVPLPGGGPGQTTAGVHDDGCSLDDPARRVPRYRGGDHWVPVHPGPGPGRC